MASTSDVPLTAEYTVAWISAIGKEYDFACELFDEEHETPPDLRADDSCYRFGRVSGHNVIMAKLPEGIAGTSPATELATKIISSFPSLRFDLMVGIAGGAPTEKSDISLGDVVVSVPVSSQRAPGLLNHQFGSSDQGTGFQLRGAAYAKHLLKCIRPQDVRQERNMRIESRIPHQMTNHFSGDFRNVRDSHLANTYHAMGDIHFNAYQGRLRHDEELDVVTRYVQFRACVLL